MGKGSNRRRWLVSLALSLVCMVATLTASAVPVTVSITDITIDDPDHDVDPGASLSRYFVSNILFAGQNVPVAGIPQIGVCALAQPIDNAAGCQDRILPNGAWSFTREVNAALGTADVLIQVRHTDPARINPIDITPNSGSPSEWGLALTINLTDGSWRVKNDPRVSPTTASSSFIGSFEAARLTGRVTFSVSLCSGGASCSDGSGLVCAGTSCTTGAASTPQCSNRPGTISCATGAATCAAPPLNLPEEQNGLDDDCDGTVDECNADQLGQTFACFGPVGTCPSVEGVRTCEVAGQPPGACVLPTNACLPVCATEVLVTNVVELRAAVQQAALTNCKDVIVLAPGVYDVYDQQLAIDDSLEIRGQGSSFGCEGLDVASFTASSLSPDLGSARCDGDDGEDPLATVLTSTAPVADDQFRRVVDIGAQATSPEVTLRHLTIRGGLSKLNFFGDEGVAIRSKASRLELYNVVVERNIAPAPGAAIDHDATAAVGAGGPSFLMVNSTVRENRCTTNSAGGGGFIGLQGDGGGMRLKGGHSFILRSSIVNNAALRGGGISAYSPLSIFNSTISGNVGGEDAGGIWFTSSDPNVSHLLELHHSTVTNNFGNWIVGGNPQSSGPGIALRYGQTAQLIGSIVAGNFTCTGTPRIRCTNDAECPSGATCFCPDSPTGAAPCVPSGFCSGGELFPPNLANTNICTMAEANCRTLEEAGQPTGSIESLGGNVASEDCGAQSSFSLPSGAATSDTVVDLQLSLSCISDRSPQQELADLFCYRGFRQGGNVGGQNDDPTQPAGFVPPPAGAPFVQGPDQNFQTAYLVGPLADNGGPTPTHAVPAGSLASGAAQTLADPGDTLDAFPSTVPACPRTDQRGFASALGERPFTCDAGSFQSAATAAAFLSADDLADELSLMSQDGDGDGIADSVDTEPTGASTFFDDALVGGSTSGQILDFGDQVLRVFDIQPNPLSGVVIIGLSEGGSEPALVQACGGTQQLLIEAGEIQWIDCSPQPGACVLATDSLTVHDRAEIAVKGVLGGAVSLGSAQVQSDVLATGDLQLAGTFIAGEAIAGGSVVGAETADIEGSVSEDQYLRRRTVATRSLTLGTQAIVVGSDQTLSLAPGAYAALQVGERAKLRLSPGAYTFSAASFGNDAALELSGFVQIAVEGALSVGDRVLMSTPAGAPASSDLIEWYTNATAVEIGHDVVWSGTLLAPLAMVTVHDRATIEGCLATRELSLGFDTVVAAPGQLSLVVAPAESEPTPSGSGSCTEGNAADLGIPGHESSVSNAGCLRVRDGYPSWWGTRTMRLETGASGQYPVPFTWTNACSGAGGSGALTGDWQSQLLAGVSAACPTLIDLQGSGAGNVTLRYWAQ